MTNHRNRNRRSRQLYRASRMLGDLSAAERGPGAFARHEARRSFWRLFWRTIGR